MAPFTGQLQHASAQEILFEPSIKSKLRPHRPYSHLPWTLAILQSDPVDGCPVELSDSAKKNTDAWVN